MMIIHIHDGNFIHELFMTDEEYIYTKHLWYNHSGVTILFDSRVAKVA